MIYIFEGIDGVGKSSLASSVYERLHTDGKNVELLYEPGSTEVGKDIRKILKGKYEVDVCPDAEFLLFVAARIQLIKEKLQDPDKIILLDRFHDSTTIYQGLNGIDPDKIRILDKMYGFSKILDDSMTFYLTTDNLEVLSKRTATRIGDNHGIDNFASVNRLAIHNAYKAHFNNLLLTRRTVIEIDALDTVSNNCNKVVHIVNQMSNNHDHE